MTGCHSCGNASVAVVQSGLRGKRSELLLITGTASQMPKARFRRQMPKARFRRQMPKARCDPVPPFP